MNRYRLPDHLWGAHGFEVYSLPPELLGAYPLGEGPVLLVPGDEVPRHHALAPCEVHHLLLTQRRAPHVEIGEAAHGRGGGIQFFHGNQTKL